MSTRQSVKAGDYFRRLLTSDEAVDCGVIVAVAVFLIVCVVLGDALAHWAGVIPS